jgi:hypothetical protein
MATAIHEFSEATVLSRVIAPDEPTMSQQAAQEVLKWRFSDVDHARMSELASKARTGTLTEQERLEVEGYERIGCLIGLVKSKARRSMNSR